MRGDITYLMTRKITKILKFILILGRQNAYAADYELGVSL